MCIMNVMSPSSVIGMHDSADVNCISTEFNLPDLAESALNSSSQETCLYHKMSKNKQYSRQDNYQMWCKVDCLVSIWCFCRKVCECVKSDHTRLGIPRCRQLSLSEKDLFNQSNIVLSENCQVSSYPQMLLVQNELLVDKCDPDQSNETIHA